MTSDNTGNKATSPNGLKYKPIMNRKLADVIENAGIVHMFEFETYGRVIDHDYLGNLASAISGKNSGMCSKYRNVDFYKSDSGMLEAVAGTAIMGKCPIRLFASTSNVGILIDPAMVNFSYICDSDLRSILAPMDTIIIPKRSLLGFDTPEENVGEEGVRIRESIRMPIRRNEADSKALSEFFNGKFLSKFKKWKKGDSIKIAHETIKCFLHNEVGVNFPGEAVRGVVLYSYKRNGRVNLDESGNVGYTSRYCGQLKGMMLANLFVEDVKQKSGISLPILHYDLNMSGELKINEVQPEPQKVARILKDDVHIKALYERFLGKQRVERLIQGKPTGQWRHK